MELQGDRPSSRILLVEDSQDDADLLLRHLTRSGLRFQARRVATRAEVLAALAERWDVVLGDYYLGPFTILDVLAEVRARAPDLPVLVVSGAVGEDAAAEAMRRGAQDFILKANLARLVPAIEREVREAGIRSTQRAQEAAVRQTQALLRSMGEGSPAGLYAVDPTGARVLFANDRFRELWGLDATALDAPAIAARIASALGEAGAASAALAALRSLQGAGTDEELALADGRRLRWRTFAVREPAEAGTLPAVSAIMHWVDDVTQARRLEHTLLLADRMVSLGTLAAGVAHEVRNPLGYASSNLELALRSLQGSALPEEELVRVLRDTEEGLRRVREIVDQLGRFSGAREGPLGPVAVADAVSAALRLTRAQLRAEVRCDLDAAPPVRADETRLVQVLVNLLLNAAQAFADRPAAECHIRISARPAGSGTVELEVGDDGPGMQVGVRERLFERFFTTKPAGVGTGLGLFICRNIVESFGGTIAVDTCPGAGTRFTLTLPSCDPEVAAATAAPLRAERRRRVLMVDDDVNLGRSLQLLAAEELDLEVEHDAQAALARLIAGERYDAILCDLHMPRLSGMDLHAALARELPAVAARMVFVTGGAYTPGAQTFLETVPSRRLDKPFTLPALLELIGRVAG